MKTLCGSLPFFATLLWMAAHFAAAPSSRRHWRWSLALSCVLLATFSLVLTETLSAIDRLSWGPVFSAWVLYTILPTGFLLASRRGLDCRSEISRLWQNLKACPAWIAVVLGGTAALILLMAVATPPMNFDVQIYHMPRQIYWLMQGSVEPFTAAHSHQISMPVLSEFIGLNLLILSGGDHWHNLVQSLFLIACCGIVGLVVQTLGGSWRASWLAVLFAALVPVVFFEASNAKDDITLAFFILVPALLALRVWSGEAHASKGILLLAALCAGLAIATKGTAIAYLPAAGLALAWVYLRQGAGRSLALAVVPGVALALLPATPQLLRNAEVFGSPAGPNLHHSNQSHSPKDLFNVAVRNAAGQFTCESEHWNKFLESRTRSLLAWAGCDADDPATTFDGQSFHLPYFAGLEDLAPAPAQTALLLLLPFGFLLADFRRNTRLPLLFAMGLLSLVIFCAIFRWQPWQGRLLIPAYFLAAPLAGILLDHLRPRWLPMIFAALALASLRPHLIYDGQRPLLGGGSILRNEKTDQMSRMMPGRSVEIRKIVEFLRASSAKRILIDGGATEIYGLLRELHQHAPELILLSGNAERPREADAIIIPAFPDAGVPVPPADFNPPAPAGFAPSWIGDYYTIFERALRTEPPILAASFGGFAADPAFSEFWKQGSSLKKSGRMATSNITRLTPQSSGPLEVQLEGTGPNGTEISLQIGPQTLQETIRNGRFEIQETITPETDLILKTSGDGVFWRKITLRATAPRPTPESQ